MNGVILLRVAAAAGLSAKYKCSHQCDAPEDAQTHLACNALRLEGSRGNVGQGAAGRAGEEGASKMRGVLKIRFASVPVSTNHKQTKRERERGKERERERERVREGKRDRGREKIWRVRSSRRTTRLCTK